MKIFKAYFSLIRLNLTDDEIIQKLSKNFFCKTVSQLISYLVTNNDTTPCRTHLSSKVVAHFMGDSNDRNLNSVIMVV